MRALIIALAALALHLFRIGEAPVHLVHDEVVFALNANSIATSGQGLTGARFPLYFHIGHNFWSTPLVVYFPSLFQLVLPPTPAVIRMPTAIIGAANIALLYLIGRRLFAAERIAIASAAILALAPAHLIHSRLGVDHLYPTVFFLGALLCFLRFEADGRKRWMAVAGTLLGIGVYSYLGAVAAMPIFAVLFAGAICVTEPARWRAAAVLIAAFAAALLPLAAWLLFHPEQIAQQLSMYGLVGTGDASPAAGLLRHFRYWRLVEYARVYHEFFNPSFLFFSGDASMIDSTRQAGVFLIPTVVFLAVGINAIINTARSRASVVILLSFLAAPIAAIVVGEVKVNRALVLLPAAALICGYGIANMMSWRARWARTAIVVLLIATAAQFAYFYWDYLGPYRDRSAWWFERNRYGAFDTMSRALEQQGGSAPVYLPVSPEWMSEHWRLYLVQHDRTEWLAQTRKLERGQLIPADAIGVMSVEDAALTSSTTHNIQTITERDGTESFRVFVPRY